MKSRNIIIAILSIVVVIMGIGYIVILSDNKTNKVSKTEEKVESITKKEYYTNMASRMNAYYKIYFKNLNVKSENFTKNVRISLKNLESYGFPMDDFVSFDKKEKCDLNKSYAVRKVKNNKYVLQIYYKCGEDKNYK